MKSRKLPPRPDPDDEVGALVATLYSAERRLAELTAGEVDTVADAQGRTFLLRHAQEQLRHSEATKQSAILNALPANIALLDSRGAILSVNEAWRQFGRTNALHMPGHAVGVNYLEVCDTAQGRNATEAKAVARGVRSVLTGEADSFSIEYPCDSPDQKRWFRMTATPLSQGHAGGAVVMHLDITLERESNANLFASELRFRQMAENINDVFFLDDVINHRMLYVSPAYETIWGRSCESLYAAPDSWGDAIHPDDRVATYEKYQASLATGVFVLEYRIVRPDKAIRWIEARGFPVYDDLGYIVRIAGVAKDITALKQAEAGATWLLSVLESSLNEIYIFDADTLHFEYVNECARRNLGYSMEKLRQQTPLFVETKFSEASFAELLAPLRHHEKPKLLCESLHRRADGSLYPIEVHLQLVERAGKAVFLALANDISERKRAESAFEALSRKTARREKMLSSALSSMSDFAQVYDKEGCLLFANQPLLELWGRDLEAVVGKNFFDLGYPKALAAKLHAQVQEVFDTRQRITDETAFTGADGIEGDYEYIFSPILDEDFSVAFVVGTTRDITQRNLAAAALKASEFRYHSLFENMLEGYAYCQTIFDKDHLRDFIYIEVNGAFEKLTGLKEVVGRKITDVIPTVYETNPEVFEIYGRVALTGLTEKHEIYLQALAIWISIAVYSAEREHFVVVFDNITSRKLAEQALQASAEEFRTLAEAVPQMVWITQADGNNIYFNQRWMEYTGLTLAQSKGQGWNKPFHPEDQIRAKDAWQFATTSHETYSIECRLRRADGIYRWWLIRGVPYHDADGAILKWFGTCTDIHDLKVAELEIYRANRALNESQVRIKYMNRVYAMLSGINTLIVREQNQDALFQEACRIAVEIGGFRMARVGIVDRQAMKMLPVASAGMSEALMLTVNVALASIESASGTMLSRAVAEKMAVVSNDSEDDPRVLFGKQYAEAGVHSMAVLPLIVSGEVVGVLALYASELHFFHEEEMTLLSELAGDIAFAIDHIAKQERLNYLAYYDALTGLANQTLFLERAQAKLLSARDEEQKLAIFVFDIERFKFINDAYGRQAGDALLKEIASRLVGVSGDATRFARIGADRFAISASGMDNAEQVGRYIAQKLNATFHGPFHLGEQEMRVSVKAGVALFPDDGDDADTLLSHAEAALKKAKASGEHYLFFTHAMTERVAERLSLENRLRQALDNQEFVLHYQPKINLKTGKLASAEALIRWNDPRVGLVPPGQFIPILEETGLIHEVGHWALQQSLSDYLRWADAGLPVVRIAVNVSPLQLRNRGFVAEIKQAIAVDVRAASGLELELTESLIMADVNHSIASLKAIREMGVTVAIDDFGTGFSSLSYLAKLPVDTLKIDRSFVIEMAVGPQGLAIVSTIINLAHALKLNVVAEGVETEEQARLLNLLNCDEMQGFLFSKAVPSEIFEAKFLSATPATSAV